MKKRSMPDSSSGSTPSHIDAGSSQKAISAMPATVKATRSGTPKRRATTAQHDDHQRDPEEEGARLLRLQPACHEQQGDDRAQDDQR